MTFLRVRLVGGRVVWLNTAHITRLEPDKEAGLCIVMLDGSTHHVTDAFTDVLRALGAGRTSAD